ncbi:Gfo/Idh/MocA family oxidoreductase [Sabulilitoribacter multivorans]|uniref:Gfo/Idh/MocA family oxidoreductase n=1 Tax=Flaviramulus multivorans TaxID=1304750 RepID=A0ABS9ILX6_9FLAO|nr:Gfo/Idh/MocA family oxidoreductase [Flaviramulus multivorans]MCF7561563.1 Gfo/Idh/MocA family oxidoreductase [Flaviramulus multivorans]
MKRRSFIKKTTAATVGIASSAYLYGNVMSNINANNTINIGVIGTGDRGGGLTTILNSIENVNVVASCDVLSFRLKEGLAKANSNPIGYSDYRRLLDNKNIDAVIVATPFNTHSKIAIDALDAGKHVYCEKTLAKGYTGIQDLMHRTNDSKLIFQTGHQYHSSRLYTAVVDLIKEGKVGKIAAFECQWNRHGNWRRRVPDPKFEKAVNWRMYREFSGGLTAELCSHQIDFVNWVLNETPNQVMGVGGIDYWKDGRETYDNVHLIYTYPNGVKAKFTCLTSNAKDGYQIKVLGDKGTIMIDTKNAWFYPEGQRNKIIADVDGVSGATSGWDAEKGYPIDVEHLDPSKQALLDFKESILNNKNPESNIVTGAKAAICVQMGLDAMYNNKIIDWNSNWNFG